MAITAFGFCSWRSRFVASRSPCRVKHHTCRLTTTVRKSVIGRRRSRADTSATFQRSQGWPAPCTMTIHQCVILAQALEAYQDPPSAEVQHTKPYWITSDRNGAVTLNSGSVPVGVSEGLTIPTQITSCPQAALRVWRAQAIIVHLEKTAKVAPPPWRIQILLWKETITQAEAAATQALSLTFQTALWSLHLVIATEPPAWVEHNHLSKFKAYRAHRKAFINIGVSRR